MRVVRKKNNTNSTTTTITTFLTHAKRVTLAFLIMASFTLAIANIHLADAQRIEFIVQFGTPEEDSANDVFADSSGDVYVVGSTQGPLPDQTSEGTPNSDAFIRKYDSGGEEIWTRQFGTEVGDSAFAVSADSSGDVYVVGSTDGTLPDQTSEGGTDAFIRKYDSDGEEIWTRQFGTSEFDIALGVSVDQSSGDVYVAGDTQGTLPDQTSEGGTDAFIRKYDSDGEEIWTRQFGTEDGASARAVSTDPSSGDVYVAGDTQGTLPDQTSEGGTDAFIRKYDSDGEEIWTRQFGASVRDQANEVSADSSGGVYVVGETLGSLRDQTNEGGTDAFIRKYDSDGEEIWTRQFGASGRDRATGVSADSSGGVYVGGGAGGAFDGETEEIFDLFIRKYDAEGDEIWTRHFGTRPTEIDTARAVSADSSGGVYMVGSTEGTFPGQTSEGEQQSDAFLAKLVDDDDEEKKDKKKHVDDDKEEKKKH